MTHELKKIVRSHLSAKEKSVKTVLATVVALEGSSYRRPGVRMLIREDGKMTGAVSGGCVEKEVFRQSESVFRDNRPKIMTYDGRYRLGCEGILYILIEPFDPDETFIRNFFELLKDRKHFKIVSFFYQKEGADNNYGSFLVHKERKLPFRPDAALNNDLETFKQEMKPCFKLVIIGAEHDAVQLCSYAALTGWEVTVIATPSEEKSLKDFPGAEELLNIDPEVTPLPKIDGQTAVMLMTHSFVKDLKHLVALKESKPAYLGLLGPSKRRERLLNDFIERCPMISDAFFDHIHGPAGLDIGAETAQEISIAIISEILAALHDKEPIMLRDKEGKIHS